jgi:hypothetical protein
MPSKLEVDPNKERKVTGGNRVYILYFRIFHFFLYFHFYF